MDSAVLAFFGWQYKALVTSFLIVFLVLPAILFVYAELRDRRR